MKYVHSIWSKPASKKNFDGSLDVKHLDKNFYTFLLSALLVKSHGNEIDLYCDLESYELYSMIPYDNINIIDFNSDGISDKFWIYGKIKTHTLMNEPYVHIDGDVLLFKDIDKERFNEKGAVVQMVENNKIVNMFDDLYRKPVELFKEVIPEVDWEKYDLSAYNCGVVGFNDNKLSKEYSEGVQNILRRLSSHSKFKDVRYKYSGMFLLAEQSYLYYFLNENNIQPLEILDYNEIIKNNFNWNKVAVQSGYTHLWGDSKYRADIITKLKNKTKKLFPDQYIIIEEFEKKYL